MNSLTPEARLIRAWRRRHDVTQQELAYRLGVSIKTVSYWECGHSTPPSRQLVEMMETIYKGEDDVS